jgi:carbon storage regulator CsrA
MRCQHVWLDDAKGDILASCGSGTVRGLEIECASNDLSMWGCTMRVLTRRIGQSFTVGGVTITVRAIRGNRVRFGFDPPEGVLISRGEIVEELDTAAAQALAGTTARSPPQAE